MKSRAMVVTSPGQMELQEFELQATPGDHVLVQTTVTSVCSTDIKVFKGKTPVGRYPLVMGHEVAGKVVELPQAIRDTEKRPAGFIKGAVVF
jgi:D-arabinose 1-dehydrogenase-like Zn-dependent alcohol dehydrogenase